MLHGSDALRSSRLNQKPRLLLPDIPLTLKDLTIVIPTLNEEENISRLLYQLNSRYDGVSTIVVDDGSTDQTQNLAVSNGAFVIDNSIKEHQGLTASVLAGILNVETKYFAVMDADFQHPPDVIGAMYDVLNDTGFHLVVGMREHVEHWPWHRKLISQGATALAKFRLSFNHPSCEDPMSGLFMGQSKFVQGVILNSRHNFVMNGYKVLFDLMKVMPTVPIANVGYTFRGREEGLSKMNWRHMVALLRSVVT
jgi:dolichol-phosphate mannosyltransferase